MTVEALRSFGQNFLKDRAVLQAIQDTVTSLMPQGTVIEVGPGTGQLTEVLLASGLEVTGIEVDPRMEPILRERFKDQAGFTLLMGDARAQDWGQHIASPQAPHMGVSNLPYYLTTPLILKYLSELPRARGFVFMVQEDVVTRLKPDPSGKVTLKRRGPLMIMGEAFGRVSVVRRVPAQSFEPAPHIASAIVSYAPHGEDHPLRALWLEAAASLGAYLEAAFTQRRRTLQNNLKMGLASHVEGSPALWLEALFEPFPELASLRPEAISAEDHLRLCLHWQHIQKGYA